MGADKLGLGPEIKELHLGDSFTNKGSAFHTFRYDFKPASVDTSKMATVDILQNNEVNVTVPHCDGAGTSFFRGPKKPYAKECVLIIDHSTGEITLERLSHNIQLKKTRPARSSSPVDSVVQPSQPTSSLTTARSSPKYPKTKSENSTTGITPAGSMPLIGDMGFMPVAPPQEDTGMIGVLSESSSDSGSDSSSSDSDSDSDIDKAPVPSANGRVASPKVGSNPSTTTHSR